MPRNVFSCHNSEVRDGGRGTDFKEVEARKVADHSARLWTFPHTGVLARNTSSAETDTSNDIKAVLKTVLLLPHRRHSEKMEELI